LALRVIYYIDLPKTEFRLPKNEARDFCKFLDDRSRKLSDNPRGSILALPFEDQLVAAKNYLNMTGKIGAEALKNFSFVCEIVSGNCCCLFHSNGKPRRFSRVLLILLERM